MYVEGDASTNLDIDGGLVVNNEIPVLAGSRGGGIDARGNTSSSSIWYELRYIEENMSLKRGHKILQLAFGSGFKCNSAVWTRTR